MRTPPFGAGRKKISSGDQAPGTTIGAPNESLKSLGATLRLARQAQSVTLREVAGQIRVPPAYLTMLEIADYSAIADEGYLLPYLRKYADFLELDARALSDRFIAGIEGIERLMPVMLIDEQPTTKRPALFTTVVLLLFVALAVYLVAGVATGQTQ